MDVLYEWSLELTRKLGREVEVLRGVVFRGPEEELPHLALIHYVHALVDLIHAAERDTVFNENKIELTVIQTY